MNTRLGKSFGLAFVVAVGILALMFALGTFNSQKAGAQQTADLVVAGSIVIESDTPSAGAAVEVKLTFDAGTEPVGDFGILEIELEGYGIPSDIDPKHVLLRDTGTPDPANGNPVEVTVSGQVISIELSADVEDKTAIFGSGNTDTIIVIRKRAGLTAPALAGTYDVRIGDETATDAVTVSASLSLDPKKGGSSTEIEVSGKAFADGTGTLYTEALESPDGNDDGIVDALIITNDGATIPDTSAENDFTLDNNGDDTKDFDILENAAGDGYVAVEIDADNTSPVTEYTINGNPRATPPSAPSLPAANYEKAAKLKDVTVDEGAFSTTIEAEDLVIGGDKGRSSIRITDANGDEARAVFQVTGTVTLGADSVGKGRVLKISLSDWITDTPNVVKIGGVPVDITDEDGDAVASTETTLPDSDPPTPNVTESYLTYVTLEGDDEDGAVFYVKVGGDVGLGSKTVVLFNRVTTLDNNGTTGEDDPTPTDDTTTHDDTRLNSSNVDVTALGLTVSPTSAVAGQEVTVEGTGFSSASDNQLDELTVGGKPQTRLSNRNPVNEYDVLSGGRIVITFAVPEEVTHGSKTIRITDDAGRVGEVALTVPKPAVTLDPEISRRATTVTVSGTGFPADENISIDYGETEDGIASGRTNNSGDFTASFAVPSDAGIGGKVDVTAGVDVDGDDSGSETTSYSADAEHMVPDKGITVTPDVVSSGDSVEIDGTGFPRYSDVEVKIGDGNFRTTNDRTDSVGDFTTSVIIPGIDPGTHVIQVDAGGEIGTWVITVPEAAVITTRPSADVFEPLATAGVLTVVWYFDNDTKGWSFYDPRPEVAAAVDLTEVTSGDNVWIQVTADVDFQGEMLTTGWNNITLD